MASETTAPDQALIDLVRAVRASGYDFVTVSPSTHARVNARASNGSATDLAGIFGWSRPFEPGAVPDRIVALMDKAGVLSRQDGRLLSTIRISSLDGCPFVHSAYPTATAEAVFFGPDTYRFANAIDAWLTPERAGRLRRAVDIGCGAGPGGILVARASPWSSVAMVDINDEALRFARVNAALAGTANVACSRSDLLGGVEGEFDLIVSNPPYLNDPLKRAYRHGGGALGADLSVRILDSAIGRLARGGTLLLYTGVAIVRGTDFFRRHAAERLGTIDVDWSYRETDPDVFGDELDSEAYAAADRIAAVVLTVTLRN